MTENIGFFINHNAKNNENYVNLKWRTLLKLSDISEFSAKQDFGSLFQTRFRAEIKRKAARTTLLWLKAKIEDDWVLFIAESQMRTFWNKFFVIIQAQ